MALSVNKENYEKEIVQETKPVVIDVFATWCGPCQHMTPIFDEIAKELGDKYKFASLNVDEARDISVKYGITSVPTFLFLKNNVIKGKIVGSMSKDDLKNKIKEFLG